MLPLPPQSPPGIPPGMDPAMMGMPGPGGPMDGPPPGMGMPPGMPPGPMGPGMGAPMDPMAAMMGGGMGGGMPMPPMPGVPMIDPLGLGLPPEIAMLLNDPDVAEQVMAMMKGERKKGPKYPKWFRASDYPEPSVGEIQQKAEQDRQTYRLLLLRFSRDRDILRMAISGVFKDYDADEETAFRDASLVFDMQLIQNLLGSADLNYEARSPNAGGDEDAEKKEDFLQCSRDQDERDHHLAHGLSLSMDEVKTATTYGHLVARILPDFNADEGDIPVSYELMDIATCFPSWEGKRGMRVMTRIYTMSLGEICAAWDRDGKNTVRTKLMTKKINGKDGPRYCELDDEMEVIEWWDRVNCKIIVRGEEVYSYKHKFGFIPFVYSRSPLGDAGPIHAENMFAWVSRTGTTLTRQLDVAGKGLSHIAFSRIVHEQREAILSRMMTMVDRDSDPPIWVEQDMSLAGSTPDISMRKGTISTFTQGMERPLPIPPPSGYQFIPPMMAAINEAVQRGMMPASSYGIQTNANQSGSAQEQLNESGMDKLTPWHLMLNQHHGESGRMKLRFIRDFGHLMGKDGERGKIRYQRSSPPMEETDEPYWELTPQILDEQGIDVKCKLTSLRLTNLMMTGQGVQMWMSMGLMTKVDALKIRGVKNPIAELKRIKIEEFEGADEVKKAGIITTLRSQGKMQEAALALMLMVQAAQQNAGGAPGGPPMPGMPSPQNGGAPPGGPGSGPPMQTGSLGMAGALPGPPPAMIGPPPGGG